MSGAEVLKAALWAGVYIVTDGGDLLLEADGPPSASVLDALKRNKQAIVALLGACPNGWSGEDCLMFFEERAAVLEFDGGLTRREAEILALEETFERWRTKNRLQ